MASIKYSNKYSLAGLNVQGIAKIKEEIEKYVANIRKYSDEFNTEDNASWLAFLQNAVKGTNSETVLKTYINNVSSNCRSVVDSLESFVTALDKLEESYKNHDNSVTTLVSNNGVMTTE